MPKKFRLLLVNANVILQAHTDGTWRHIIERCEIHLTETVVEESQFYEDADGVRHEIELQSAIAAGDVTVHSVTVSQLQALRARFGTLYQEKLDDSEAESLAILLSNEDKWLLTSADKIVYRVLSSMGRGEQGVSLEEILQQTGLGRPLPHMFTKRRTNEFGRGTSSACC